MDLIQLARELTKYSELENTELGEVCELLIQIVNLRYYISEEFKQALEKEMEAQLQNFKAKCKIVTRKVKTTEIIKELEWDY